MFQRILPFIAFVTLALPLRADPAAQVDDLLAALRLPETLEVMAQEGTEYGGELEAEMFAGHGGARWQAMVARIYDVSRMEEIMREALEQELAGQDVAALTTFFASELGARIVELEISARRALLDDDVDAENRLKVEEMRADDDPRLELLEQFVTANELIEFNVVGGMNANYAFYRGLSDGGAFPFELSEEEMLADVWSQEDDVRQETEEWMYSYLSLAYEPLEDADLSAYITLSETPAGQALNRALFAGYDVVFRKISRELGLGAAQFMAGQDI
tara:strand:- start:559 stop:1383 length:825 start_codon:yes stop_codon:yes gene_type:complete